MKASTLFGLSAITVLTLSVGTLLADDSKNPPKLVSVNGFVQLEGLSPAAKPQPVTFAFTPVSSYEPMPKTIVFTSGVGTGGSVQFTLPVGHYSLTIKGEKWLSVTLAVDATSNPMFKALLPGGDVNNDNQVTKADWYLVYHSIHSKPGEPKFDPRADANCDGVVDVTDLKIVEQNLYPKVK